MKTLLRGIQLNGKPTNILINGNRFESVNAPDNAYANTAIECHRYAILPAFYNAHNHAAMTILRGYADDMPLQTWLEDHIWPKERAMGRAEVYEGSVMAINEMISSGTVFFNDMYFSMSRTATAVREAGIRAAIGVTYMDSYSDKMKASKEERICNWMEDQDSMIQITAAPHAVYTVSGENLQKLYRLARDHERRFHIHVSETRKEVEDCMKAFGMTPVRYLDKLGVLGPDVIAAHCVHVDREEWDILAERGVTVVHCPCSNMKLGSGRFPYEMAIESGVRVTLGTDGCSSNNNLDMREEMKFAALLAKLNGDTSLLSAPEVLKWATVNGAEAFGIDAGVIADGKLADAIIVDLASPRMRPCYNLISNWVYAADSSCIRMVLCNGKIILDKRS